MGNKKYLFKETFAVIGKVGQGSSNNNTRWINSFKAINVDSFEIICVAKKAVRGMAKILGIYKSHLVVADSNKITLWDRQTIQFGDTFDFPTGQFNKGVVLDGNRVFGSDYQSVYSTELE